METSKGVGTKTALITEEYIKSFSLVYVGVVAGHGH